MFWQELVKYLTIIRNFKQIRIGISGMQSAADH